VVVHLLSQVLPDIELGSEQFDLLLAKIADPLDDGK
jgi:hypothetical protein